MERFILYLKGVFWGDWLFSLLSCIGIALIVWLIYLSIKPVEVTVGVSSDSFNIFCGVVATLNGALLGLVIAARGFTTHYAMSSLQNNKDILSHEGHWLESWLSSKKFQNEDISHKLETLCDICKGASTITEKEMESDEYKNVISSTIKSFLNLREEYKTKADEVRKKFEELEAKNIPENDESLLKLKEDAQLLDEELTTFEDSLKDSSDHINAILVSLSRIRTSFLSFDLVGQLDRLASIAGIMLIIALIFLILFGSNILGPEFPLDSFRLYVAVYLILMFSFAILMTYRILSLHRRIVDIEIGRKS
jgi:hypothetical protein